MTNVSAKKRKLLPFAILGIITVLAAGFFVSRAGLDKALVKQHVDAVIASIKEQGRDQGRDIDIRYKEITIAGGFLDKHVVLLEPSISIKPLEREPLGPDGKRKMDSLVITTEYLLIDPKAVDLSSVTYSLPKPINFAPEDAPEKSLLKIEPSTPIAATMTKKKQGETSFTEIKSTLPQTIDITYLREQKAEGVEDATPTITPVYSSLGVQVAPDSTIYSHMADDDSGFGSIVLAIGNVTLTPKETPEGIISIAGVKLRWSNEITPEQRRMLAAKADIGPITAAQEILPYAPVALALDLEVDAPSAKENASAEAQKDASLKLKTFSITTKEAALTGEADFTSTAGDMLPTGTAKLQLTNFQYVLNELRKNGVFKATQEQTFLPMIEKISGKPVAEIQEFSVPISRQKGGAFMIGNASFEELFALLLQQAARPNTSNAEPVPHDGEEEIKPQSGLVPQLPPVNRERSAPLPVPDQSVRG